MSTTAYKLKADATFPRPIRKSKRPDGETFWVVEGISYDANATITEDVMTENDIKRARAGDLDHLLEPLNIDSPTAEAETVGKDEVNPFLKITESPSPEEAE